MKKTTYIGLSLCVVAYFGLASIEVWNCEPKTTKTQIGAKYKAREACVNVTVLQNKLEIVKEEHEDNGDEEYCDSLEMLAVCVEAEAGNQGLKGKRLVVDVILNRVDSPTFPDDIVSVITQRNQFSTYTDGAMDRVKEPSEETIKAVQMELDHRLDTKILYFTAGGYNPYCKPAYKYKDHYFGY